MGNKNQSGSKTSQVQTGCTDFRACWARPWEHHPFPTQERRHHHFSEGAHSHVPAGIHLVLSKKLLLPGVVFVWWQLLPGCCMFLCYCSIHFLLRWTMLCISGCYLPNRSLILKMFYYIQSLHLMFTSVVARSYPACKCKCLFPVGCYFLVFLSLSVLLRQFSNHFTFKPWHL